MWHKSFRSLISLIFLALLPGCGMGGDWPNLSDRMPDPATRARVIDRADPSVAPRELDAAPQTPTDAQALLAEIEQAIRVAQGDFETSMQSFETSRMATGGDSDALHSWMEVQLMLTRLSQTASRLDAILFSTPLSGTAVHAAARETKDRIDTLVIAARQRLAAIRPRA